MDAMKQRTVRKLTVIGALSPIAGKI